CRKATFTQRACVKVAFLQPGGRVRRRPPGPAPCPPTSTPTWAGPWARSCARTCGRRPRPSPTCRAGRAGTRSS
ncbi:MAG: hypothetical protein AVDCRST_MAG66-3289, partial [uncultured Pseudonocardia sp.]